MKLNHVIDIHKFLTAGFILSLIVIFDGWENQLIWIYLGIHGSYGILWFLKGRIFPDRRWKQEVNPLLGIGAFLGMMIYLVPSTVILYFDLSVPFWWMSICIIIFAIGVFFHFVADMQKFEQKRLEEINNLDKKLITTGLWSNTRNPNYFGEFLIYGSFALLTLHYIPILVFIVVVACFWVPLMLRKDKTLEKYEKFTEYKQQSNLFIPFVL